MEIAIFDIDGTLLDSVDLHARAWQEALESNGRRISLADIRWQIGKGGDQLLPIFLSAEELKLIGKTVEENKKRIFVSKYQKLLKSFPNVRSLLIRLKNESVCIVLASSAADDEVEQYKRILGVEDLIEAQTSSSDVEHSKPYPDIFLSALSRAGSKNTDRALVIGDSPYDAMAASRAGIAVIGVRCGGFPDDKLLESGCSDIFDGPSDLLFHYNRFKSAFSSLDKNYRCTENLPQVRASLPVQD